MPKGKIEQTEPVVVLKFSDEVAGLLDEFDDVQTMVMRRYKYCWQSIMNKYLRLASAGNKKMIKFYLETENPGWIKILHPLLLAEYNTVQG